MLLDLYLEHDLQRKFGVTSKKNSRENMYNCMEQGSEGPMVPGSQGPRYLKVIFKYELDSKEGPSCFQIKPSNPKVVIKYFKVNWACLYNNIFSEQKTTNN